MDTKALRQKILDLAIRGKLVPQDPSDEPASVLLEKIREEKARMVKEGKLKKKDIKNDSIIYVGEDNLHYEKFQDGTEKCIEDEIPFEVPAGWEWTRIGSICIINPRNNISDSLEVSFVPMSLISEGYTNMYTYEIRTWSKVKSGFTHFAENDIGIAKITPCFENRKSVIFKDLVNGYGAGTTELHILRTLDDTISNEYLLWIAKMDSFIQGGVHTFSGAVGQQRVGKDYISQYLIPVPPRNEQTRIIQKINSIFEFIIRIENAKEDLEEIIRQAKSKILDLAIRGQLVPQDPNDEPASVLLERIRAEKEELIKQGKIKRDKKESIIFKGEDNSYYEIICNKVNNLDDSNLFDLPDNWCWCRMRSIADVKGGKRLPKGCNFSDTSTNHAYIRVTDMKNRTINTTDLRYISDEVYEQIKSYIISKNDLYITIAGTIGLVGEIPDELDNMNLTENAAKICNIKINKKYLLYILSSQFVQNQFQEKTHQVAMPKLALERILTTIIPIPPFKEQLLIVKKIEEILCRMDAIENCTY